MPRKAPKEVKEHRITLGDYERAKLDKLIEAYNRDKYLENIPNMMLGVAGLGIAATIGFVGYALYYWLDSVPSIKDVINEATGRDIIETSVKGATTSILTNMTKEELEAAIAKKRETLENVRKKASEMVTSKAPMIRIMGQKLIDGLPAAEEKLEREITAMREAWENTQIQKTN
jgi:hypothetical protein